MTTLVARVRVLLDDQPTLREVPMFGGRSIMVEDRMVVSVTKSGPRHRMAGRGGAG